MPVGLHMSALQVAGSEGDLASIAGEWMRRLDICLRRGLRRSLRCHYRCCKIAS